MVLEGTDQILNRIGLGRRRIAQPQRTAGNKLPRARNQRGNIQILDLGITPKAAATSSPPTPAPTPYWTPCWSKTTHSPTQKTRWAPNLRRLRSSGSPAPQEGLCFQRQPGEHHRCQELERIRQRAVTAYSNPPASTRMTRQRETAAAAPGPSPWQQSCCSSSSQAVSSHLPWAQSGSNQAAAPHTPKSSMSSPPDRLRQTPTHRHPRPLGIRRTG